MKPVAAGSEDGRWSDVDALIAASTVRAPANLVNPYAFEPAIAPHIAAELAGTGSRSSDRARLRRAVPARRGRGSGRGGRLSRPAERA